MFGNARYVHSIVEDAKMNLGVRVVSELKDSEINTKVVSTIEEEDVAEAFATTQADYVDIPTDQEQLTEALEELDDLIGLDDMKQEVRNMIKLTRYYREINKDIRKSFSIHSIFTGNPGTGKTTVARIIGKIYKALGILERGHLVESDASDLIAGFVGQSALKTREKIEEAMGGILFIDEAYSMTEGRNAEFGKKAVAALLKQMEDRRGKFAVIVAGYPEPMDNFIRSNPGLKSRFDQTFHFNDFSADELMTIAKLMLAQAGLTPNDEAAEYLKDYLSVLHQGRNQFFGNARTVRKIVEKVVRKQNLRMASLAPKERTKEMLKLLSLEDVQDFSSTEISVSRQPVGFRIR